VTPLLRDRPGIVCFAIGATLLPPIVLSSVTGLAVSELWSSHAESDRLLLVSGGAGLLETARLTLPFWRAAGVALVPSLALLTFGSLFVWSAALDAFRHDEPLRPRDVAASSVVHVGRLAALYGVFLVARAGVVGVTVLLVQGIAPALARDGSERTQSLVAYGAAAVGLCLLELVRIAHDLSTAATVRHDAPVITSIITALGAFRDRFARLLARRLPYVVAAALLIVLATLGAAPFWESGAALVLRAGLHQTALAGLVVLRLAWLRGLLDEVGERSLTTQVDEPSDL
jgi:hypothetical protein